MMNPEQMGLMGGQPGPMPQQQGMPGQPGPEAGLPPEGMPPEGMPPEGQPPMGGPEGAEPPMEDLSEEELQAQYENAYMVMTTLIDEKETFDATRKMLESSRESDMGPEMFGQMVSAVIQRVEKDTGPLAYEVVEALIEHLIEESDDRWGISFDDDEVTRAGSAAFGLYFQAHPDKVPFAQEELEEMFAEEGGEEVMEEEV